MNDRKYVATTKNGHKVFVDLQKSHAATHLADNNDLLKLVSELIENSEVNGDSVTFEKDKGRIIGNMDFSRNR